MSLLLDALKKAAKDKQAKTGADGSKPDESQQQTAGTAEQEELAALEFTVDEENTPEKNPEENIPADDSHATHSETDAVLDSVPLELEADGPASPGTVSDDALQMLIYKTNREHRRKQKIIWTGLATSFVVVLVTGAYYFYTGMVEDVESLELKHRIAMRSVHAQEVKVRTPVAQLPAQKQTIEKNAQTQAPPERVTAVSTTSRPVASASTTKAAEPMQVNRTSIKNPISGWLNEGYAAYKMGDYKAAKDAYSQVLNREQNNRDALLGLGAIAMKQNDAERAKFAYQRLLKLDPRDPIANAALANLDAVMQGELTESRIKFLLEQQPNAAHLHYALGNIYARQQQWPQAQRSYFSAWQGDNSNADYAFNLAVSLDRIGKAEQAKRFYQNCLQLANGQNISFSIPVVQQRLQQLNAGANKS